jgi:hypothetical protein
MVGLVPELEVSGVVGVGVGLGVGAGVGLGVGAGAVVAGAGASSLSEHAASIPMDASTATKAKYLRVLFMIVLVKSPQ